MLVAVILYLIMTLIAFFDVAGGFGVFVAGDFPIIVAFLDNDNIVLNVDDRAGNLIIFGTANEAARLRKAQRTDREYVSS